MRYLLTNEILDAVLSSTTGDSNYPVKNLQDRFLQKRFQSTGEISQITSLLDTVAACNCIAQGFTNATSIYSYLYGAGQGLFQGYTNLVQNPTDLTTGNWTAAAGAVITLLSESINGNTFSKVEATSSSNARGEQEISFLSSNPAVLSINIRKDVSNIVDFDTFDTDDVQIRAQGKVTFSTESIVIDTGTLLSSNFIDDDNVEIYILTTPVIHTNTNVIRCFAGNIGSIVNGDSAKYTAVQIINNTTTMFSFTDDTHLIDTITETQMLPDKCTIVLKNFNPRFAFNVGVDRYVLAFELSATQRILFRFEQTVDTFRFYWQDGGTIRYLESQKFGDGFVNINQRIDFYISLDLLSGGINDSRFISIPKESGALREDISWSGTPDIKSSTFPTLSIGHANSIQQADSIYESLCIYEGLLVGEIADIDIRLADMTLLFDWEPDDVIFKKSVTHNIDDDTDFTYFDSVDVKQIVTTIEGPTGVYLGGLGAGEYLQLPDPLADFDRPLQDNSFVEQNASGQVLANYEKPLQAPSFRFPPVLPTLANLIRNGYIDIGKGTPFYADFFENNRDYYAPLYCIFQNEPGDQKNSKRIEYAVDLLEAR